MNDRIRCELLTKYFRKKPALSGVSLAVPSNSIYALLGPNGAGKSTLIKLLLNLERPSSGNAYVLGTQCSRITARQLRRIGYVSEAQDLPEWMTVSYLFRYLKPFYPTWDDSLAGELLEQFKLPREQKLKHLSRGMKMKAALAASLAYRPELIVLDEPFSGLDAIVRDELIQGLLDRAATASILISSHDLAEIETFASHVGYLDSGVLQFSEEMTSLRTRFRRVEISLEEPTVLPSRLPPHWLNAEAGAAVVQFVETAFEPERTRAEITRIFPGARDVAFQPMPLRDIFVSLGRERREAV